MREWTHQIDRALLPAAIREGEPDVRRRARVLATFAVMLGSGAGAIAATALSFGLWLPGLDAAAIAVATAGVPWGIRRGASIERMAVLVALLVLAAATHAAYLLGGWGAPPLSWYVAMPLLVLLVAGRRLGVAFAALSIAGYSVFFALHEHGVTWPHATAPPVARFVDTVTLTTVIFGLALSYESFKQQALSEVRAANTRLEAEVEEHLRARERIEQLQAQLVDGAHAAGMAEVAASVLHNVGNALNRITTSASLASAQVSNLKLAGLDKLGRKLSQEATSEAQSLAARYLVELHKTLEQQRGAIAGELTALNEGVERVAAIVDAERGRAGLDRGRDHPVDLRQVIDDALRLDAAASTGPGVRVTSRLEDVPPVVLDRHKVLVVFMDVLRRAGEAVRRRGSDGGEVDVRLRPTEAGAIRLEVADNGLGVDPEQAARMLEQGYTTGPEGRGAGLHDAALAAASFGGRITFHSDGPDRGATLVLDIPGGRSSG